jgi:hypothetical protein
LAEEYLRDYRINRKKSLSRAELSVNKLRESFEGLKAASISTSIINAINAFVEKQVDRQQGIVRLEVGETNNNDARTVYLDDELKSVFDRQWEIRKRAKKLLPYVFLNRSGTERLKRFDKRNGKRLVAIHKLV